MKPYLLLAFLILALFEIYSLMPYRKDTFHVGDLDRPPYLTGAIHIHTSFGEGSRGVPDIAEAARKAGLDFFVVTDLDTSKARQAGFEKRYGNVDAFVEMETTTPAGHALAFYSQTEAVHWPDAKVIEASWHHFLGHETVPGLFTVVAHPSSLKTPWNRLDRFPDGVEVVNFDSTWRRELDESFLGFALTVLTYPFNQYLMGLRFSQVYPKDLTAWDSMNAVSPGHFGILAHDAREKMKLTDSLALPWPSYVQAFQTAANIVYIDAPTAPDFEARKAQIYRSLRAGRSAMVYRFIYPFEGNDWKIQCGDHAYRSGMHVPAEEKCEQVIKTPEPFPYERRVLIFRNGEVYKDISVTTAEVRLPIDGAGSYRAEIWVKAFTRLHLLQSEEEPYILYNPIYVR